jgi:hypothetical protein
MKKKEHGLQAAAWLYQLLVTRRVPISMHLLVAISGTKLLSEK